MIFHFGNISSNLCILHFFRFEDGAEVSVSDPCGNPIKLKILEKNTEKMTFL